jgi:hypothetical protein
MLLPVASDWRTSSPLESAKTTPLAMIGGSGTLKSREIHAGRTSGLLSFPSIRKAMMLPLAASPLVTRNTALGCGGPQAGANSQRAPCASTQVANEPQNPWPA